MRTNDKLHMHIQESAISHELVKEREARVDDAKQVLEAASTETSENNAHTQSTKWYTIYE